MSENVNETEALKILHRAFNTDCIMKDNVSNEISTILMGSHLTFKYILITALLGKATNPNVNPLALQAGAPFDGAYDARSLCHNVLVPFERDNLNRTLGASNEPFLNKPARFTHLSRENPVRRGNDKALLFTLIDALQSIKTSDTAFKYLTCALSVLKLVSIENESLVNTSISYDPTLVEVYDFCIRFLDRSFGGASLAITVGTIEKLYHRQLASEYNVKVHKVNQSGSSSKEIGDIDIYMDRDFVYAIEVKDKDFSRYDLEHSVRKVQENDGGKSHFIFGPNACFDAEEIKVEIAIHKRNGFLILIQDVFHYARAMLFRIDLENTQDFVATLKAVALEVNSSKEMFLWINEIVISMGWK